MNIKIRKATEEDLSAILNLYAQPEMDNGKILSEEQARNLFKKMQSYPCYQLFVAVVDEKILGSFALLIMDNLTHLGAPSAIVENVVVDPRYHGQGVGKQMMNFAMKICKEAGCYKLALSSNVKRLNAHKFYESLGFQRRGFSFVVG